jgi:FkbM family methyltransferase
VADIGPRVTRLLCMGSTDQGEEGGVLAVLRRRACFERARLALRVSRSSLLTSGPPSARLRLAHALCSRIQPLGAGRLRHRIYPAAIGRRDDLRFIVRALTGSLYTGSTSDHHAHVLAAHGYAEWRQWAIALAVCREGDTIVEVGANVGTETVAYSDIVGAAGRVIAFEPLESNRQALLQAAELFRHDNVTVYPYALGDRRETLPFARPPEGGSSGIGHVLGPDELRSGTVTYMDEPIETVVEPVEMRALDSMLDGDPRLIAMDAEGSELAILRGARDIIVRTRPVLVLEASFWHQQRAGSDLRALHAALVDLGYRTFKLGRIGMSAINGSPGTAMVETWIALPAGQERLAARIQRLLRRTALTPCIGTLNPLSAPHRRSRRT